MASRATAVENFPGSLGSRDLQIECALGPRTVCDRAPYHSLLIRRIIPTEFLSRASCIFLHETRELACGTPDKIGFSKAAPNRQADPGLDAIVWAAGFPNPPVSKTG